MSKKVVFLFAIFILSQSVCGAELRASRRSNYTGKFMIIRELVSLSGSKSEKVAINALNKLREVLFRSKELLQPEAESYREATPESLVNKMNYDVDKIFQAIHNLENIVQVANFDNQDDRKLLSTVKTFIIDEIKLILSSADFLGRHEKLSAKINKLSDDIEASNPADSRIKEKNRNVITNLEKLLDLSWYIYAEQLQWFMTTAFRLERLNFEQVRNLMPMAIAPEINLAPPPRMFVPGHAKDYELNCSDCLK